MGLNKRNKPRSPKNFEISEFQNFKFPNFKVSQFQSFRISKLPGTFKVIFPPDVERNVASFLFAAVTHQV